MPVSLVGETGRKPGEVPGKVPGENHRPTAHTTGNWVGLSRLNITPTPFGVAYVDGVDTAATGGN